VFTLPITTKTLRLDHGAHPASSSGHHVDVMPMVYPAVSSTQQQKYGTLSLYGNLIEYYITISVGTPAQIFTLQVDTGSAITALPSQECTDCYEYNTPYNSSASSTATVLSCADSRCTANACNSDGTCRFSVSYGDSSFISGNLVSDVLALPFSYKNSGSKSSPVNTVTSSLFQNTPVIFGAMTDQSQGFQFKGVDGIMGLAFGQSKLSCVPNCASLVMDSIVQSHNIADVFSIALQPITNNSAYNEPGGSITFGGIDTTFLGSNTVYYTDVVARPYYQILLGDVSIGGVSIGANIQEFGQTIVDSGTTYTLVPPVIYNLIVSTMQNNYCHLPFVCGNNSIFTSSSCVNSSKIDLSLFPDFTFWMDGVKVVMKPSQYLIQGISNRGSVNCWSIVSGASGKTFLGDNFMMGTYIVFDRENERVGFANDQLVSAGPRIDIPSSKVAIIAAAAGGGAALLLIIIAVIVTVLLRRRAQRREADRTQDIGVTVQAPSDS